MSTPQYAIRRQLGRYGGAIAIGGIALSLSAMSVFAQATPPASPAVQQACVGGSPSLQLANPSAGDVLLTGDYIVSGAAWETGGPANEGVTRVDLFLGNRDSGGLFLGSGVPGQEASDFTSGSELAMTGFAITTTVPNIANGGHDFVAYAYSPNGQETSVSVPIFVGAPPVATPLTSTSPAPIPLVSTTTHTGCAAAASAAATTGATMVAPAAQPSAVATSVGAMDAVTSQAPLLVLSNPSAGDLLNAGTVVIEGVAYDPAATSGAGVDTVDLFLGDRNAGGLFLGSGVPGASINPLVTEPGSRLAQTGFAIRAEVPATVSGSNTLFGYAHSSLTNKETIVTIPVNVGTPPSPTPRPATT
jgi:hypothetical protein